jgi:CHASE3 domain sensor protein
MSDDKFDPKPYIIGFILGVVNCYMCYSIIQSKYDVRQLNEFLQLRNDIDQIKSDVSDLKKK